MAKRKIFVYEKNASKIASDLRELGFDANVFPYKKRGINYNKFRTIYFKPISISNYKSMVISRKGENYIKQLGDKLPEQYQF